MTLGTRVNFAIEWAVATPPRLKPCQYPEEFGRVAEHHVAESQGIRQGLRGGWVEQILATLLEKPYRGEMVYFEGAVGMGYTPHHMCGHESLLGHLWHHGGCHKKPREAPRSEFGESVTLVGGVHGPVHMATHGC